jgi:ATP-dependent Clp protease ATP-binding subunit ClpA/heme-degrading monooxygenase HmoA
MFERFTERGRQTIVLAQDEARGLRHNYIGTEHLLLGLLREEDSPAWAVLHSLGVELADARQQVAGIVGPGEQEVSGQIPFTPRSKKVLELALREATSLGHDYIGTEHILLGIVRENQGVAAQILRDLGADAETVRNAVIAAVPGRPRGVRPPRQWRRRRHRFGALAAAREEALEDGNYDLARKLLELEIEERAKIASTPKTEEKSMRTVALVHHRVADFDAWKQVFDSFKGAMRDGGIRWTHVWRAREDPNTVVVISVFDDPDAARAFFDRADLREAMGNAGVDTSTLRIEFLDEVEGGEP